MSPEHVLDFPGAPRHRGPAGRISPSAAVALWVTAGIVWVSTTRPARALGVWNLDPDARLTGEQWAVMVSSFFGVLVLLAGLFAIAVYAVHWPAIETREQRRLIAVTRGELAELHVMVARIARRIAALQDLRAEMAAVEAELLRAREDTARQAGRAMGSGREVLDDILSELRAAAAPGDER